MKNIQDTLGLYQADENGNIFRNGKSLAKINNGNNYLCVVLSVKGVTKRKYIHRIICETYLENPLNKKEVNHKDGNKLNNKLTNLEWATRSENQKHRYDVLKHVGANKGKVGKLNVNSKPVIKMLNGKEIERFESVLQAGKITGIGESNIRGCIYGKSKTAGGFNWKYV